MKAIRLLEGAAALAGLGVAGYAGYSALTWARYGNVDLERHPRDEMLERFMPDPEVDEYHSFTVDAPADITFSAAKDLDVQSSPLVKGIFWLRAIPSMLRGEPFRPGGPRGIVAETLAQGWGVLGEVPGREILVGAYTQPWHEDVTFHPLPPERFASFDEPGYVKIIWTLGAEPLGPKASRFVTRTRVVCTDDEARRRFRLYWAPMSAGIILIRYLGLPLVRRAAERRNSASVPCGVRRRCQGTERAAA